MAWLEWAGIRSSGCCSTRECPAAHGAGSLPTEPPGCAPGWVGSSRPGAGGFSSLHAALGTPAEHPGASLAPLWEPPSPLGIWGMIPARMEGSAASAAPAPSPRLRGGRAAAGLWGQISGDKSLPPGLLAASRAASPPRPPVLSLGAAEGNARDVLPGECGAGGGSCASGDFGELPGAATRPLLVPSGGSCPPAAALPGATHSSGSASGDGGSDPHSVSTIWGREKARLAGAASGS